MYVTIFFLFLFASNTQKRREGGDQTCPITTVNFKDGVCRFGIVFPVDLKDLISSVLIWWVSVEDEGGGANVLLISAVSISTWSFNAFSSAHSVVLLQPYCTIKVSMLKSSPFFFGVHRCVTQLCNTEKLSGLLWKRVKVCLGPLEGQKILNQVLATFLLSE